MYYKNSRWVWINDTKDKRNILFNVLVLVDFMEKMYWVIVGLNVAQK